MDNPDSINSLLSTIASCSGTIVAIVGGFIASRLIEISTQRREAIIKLKEIADEVTFKRERISKIEESFLSTEAEDFVISHISDLVDEKALDEVYEQSSKNFYSAQDFRPYWDSAVVAFTKLNEALRPENITLNEDKVPISLGPTLTEFEYEVVKAVRHELDARRSLFAATMPYQTFSVMDSLQKQKDEEELAQLKASNEWLLIQQRNLQDKKLSLMKPRGMKSGLVIFALFSVVGIIFPLIFMDTSIDLANTKWLFIALFVAGVVAVFGYLVHFLSWKSESDI